jgi:hypothetical protein
LQPNLFSCQHKWIEEFTVTRRFDFPAQSLRLVAAALLAAYATGPTFSQQEQGFPEGLVDDWISQHVVFSNPGTMQDAMKNGRLEEWLRIVNDPRYRMQQMKRNLPWAGQAAIPLAGFPPPPEAEPADLTDGNGEGGMRTQRAGRRSLRGDWQVTLGTSNHGVALAMSPAKYTLAVNSSPSCANDFVIYPINANGSTTQASLVGLNNLYTTTCSGTVPTVLFAYNVGTGVVQTSPVISLDGTKVAFVENTSSGWTFHVLTPDKRGNGGCPSSSPCNGTSFSAPQPPGGTLNTAVDTKISSTTSHSTNSSPYVDYTSDTAYVGDDSGNLHKFTGVFKGTLTEAGSPWPVSVISGQPVNTPVFDSVSQHIFASGNDGNLYCLTPAGAFCTVKSISVGAGTPILDGPVVDSAKGTVFAEGGSGGNSVLTQATTALGSQVNVTMGVAGTNLYRGAFDNLYFTAPATGHMYFCGNLTTAATPTLYRVGFNTSGTMNSTKDTGSFQLVVTGSTGTGSNCTPLTHIFNSSLSTDFLFVGVQNNGFTSGTPNCGGIACVMSFNVTSSSFPTGPGATLTATALTSGSISGMIVDNVSSSAGASQVYFGNLQLSAGIQASQSALR